MGKLGILGGTSLFNSSVFSQLQSKTVSTPHGDAILYIDSKIVFIQRHHADGAAGSKVYRPPHLINHKANLAAMQKEGVDKIVAVCSVGSLSEKIQIGHVIVPDDYFYLFGPPVSYYDDKQAHIVPGFDVKLRENIIEALLAEKILGFQNTNAVYVQVTGPRFETRSEIRFLSSIGDVIGMTAASEATIAKELKIPYAMLAMVDNMGNGLASSRLTKEIFMQNVTIHQGVVERSVAAALEKLLPKA